MPPAPERATGERRARGRAEHEGEAVAIRLTLSDSSTMPEQFRVTAQDELERCRESAADVGHVSPGLPRPRQA